MASRAPVVIGADGLPQQLQPGDDLAFVGAAWTAFTPVISPGFGSFTATAAGNYKQIGKTVHFTARISITSAGTTAGSSNYINFGLPVTAVRTLVNSYGGECQAVGFGVMGYALNTSTILLTKTSDGTNPIGTNYVIVVSGTYEAA